MDERRSYTLEELFAEIAPILEQAEIRRENPYVLYLIAVLYPHNRGLPRRQVIREVEKRRAAKGLNMPAAFEETVQASFQAYAGEYASFKARNAPPSDDLFFAATPPKGMKGMWWGVRRERAESWMTAKKKAIGLS